MTSFMVDWRSSDPHQEKRSWTVPSSPDPPQAETARTSAVTAAAVPAVGPGRVRNRPGGWRMPGLPFEGEDGLGPTTACEDA